MYSHQISDILNFKGIVKTAYVSGRASLITPSTTDKANYYYKILTTAAIKRSTPILPKLNIYLKNYFTACLISIFMEEEGEYSLELWNAFRDKICARLVNKGYPINMGKNEGVIFELFILHTINNSFPSLRNNIRASRISSETNLTLLDDEYAEISCSEYVKESLLIHYKPRGEAPDTLWGDNDIIVLGKLVGVEEVICIISCKASLRERISESGFWSTHFRGKGIARYTLATLDKGDVKRKSEIGLSTAPRQRKNRKIIKSNFDRAYVFRESGDVDRDFIIKDLEYLETDLRRWREDYFGL